MRLVVRSIFFYCFPSFKRMLASITFTLSLYSIYSRLFLPCSSFFYFFLSVFALISMLVKSQFLKTIEREREKQHTHTHTHTHTQNTYITRSDRLFFFYTRSFPIVTFFMFNQRKNRFTRSAFVIFSSICIR